jgi:hypothetical protein
MIIGIFIAIGGIGLWALLSRVAKRIEQKNYERERFALMVAQELDRLEKEIQENNRKIAIAESCLEPETKWWGRN